MKITAEPKSDQWNAADFIAGPRTFTIADTKEGGAEQKYDIALVEGGGRAWRPPLTIIRLLMAAWGDESDAWKGRRVTLFCDADVRFGSDAVGGIRVSHMSDLPGNKKFSVRLPTSRGKGRPYTVEPLPDAPAPTQQSVPVTSPLVAAFEASGIDKSKWLAYSGQVVGRELASANDLTAAEQVAVVDALNQDAAAKAAEGQA